MARTALNLIDPALRHCIDECLRCHEVCLSTIPYCLEQGGRHATEAHVTSLYDCAAICGTTLSETNRIMRDMQVNSPPWRGSERTRAAVARASASFEM